MVKLDTPDKYTLKFTFTNPHAALYLHSDSRQPAAQHRVGATPSQYMKELHEDTTSDKAKLAADVKAKGFDSWERYYLDYASAVVCQPGSAFTLCRAW